MKKITLILLVALFGVFTSYGQQVLSHSTNNTVSDGGSVACATDPDGAAGTGDEGVSDNIFYRAYTPADFGFTGDFNILGSQFFLTYTDTGGNGAVGNVTLRFFTSDDVFPAGNLTEIASQAFVVDASTDVVNITEMLLDTPVVVDAATEIIVAIDVPAAAAVPDNADYRIGMNNQGEDDPGYISSIACGIPAPTDIAAIGFPTNNIILDLIGDAVLSVEDNILAENLSLFPNPTNGDMTLDFARSFGQANVAITNITGQNVMNVSTDGIGSTQLETSRLASGIYFAQIATDNASTVIKFVKN